MFLEGIDFNVLKSSCKLFRVFFFPPRSNSHFLLLTTCWEQHAVPSVRSSSWASEKHYFLGVSAGVRVCPKQNPLSLKVSATTIQISLPLLTKSLKKVLLQVLLPRPLNVTSLNKAYECSHVININSVVVSICPSSKIMEFSSLFSMGYLTHLSVWLCFL